jgi:hypothetical protein
MLPHSGHVSGGTTVSPASASSLTSSSSCLTRETALIEVSARDHETIIDCNNELKDTRFTKAMPVKLKSLHSETASAATMMAGIAVETSKTSKSHC